MYGTQIYPPQRGRPPIPQSQNLYNHTSQNNSPIDNIYVQTADKNYQPSKVDQFPYNSSSSKFIDSAVQRNDFYKKSLQEMEDEMLIYRTHQRNSNRQKSSADGSEEYQKKIDFSSNKKVRDLEEKCSQLTMFLQTANTALERKNQEIYLMNQEMDNLRIQLLQSGQSNQIPEEKFHQLVEQLDLLHDALSKKQDEVDRLNQKLNLMKDQQFLINQASDNEARYLQEIQFLRQKLENQEKENLSPLQDKIVLISEEMEKLSFVLKSKVQENEELKAKIEQIEIQNNQAQNNEINRLTVQIETKNQQLKEIKQIDIQRQQLKDKLYLVTNELQKATIALSIKHEESESYKQKLKQYEDYNQQLSYLQHQIDTLQMQVRERTKQFDLSQDEIRKLQQIIKQKQDVIQSLDADFAQIKANLDERYEENEFLKQNVQKFKIKMSEYQVQNEGQSVLKAEIERLVQLVRQKEIEIDKKKSEMELLGSKLEIISKENAELQKNVKDLDEYRNKYNDIQLAQREMQQQLVTFSKTTNQNKSFEVRIKELELQMSALEQERRRLQALNQQKNEEFEQFRANFYQISLQLNKTEEELKLAEEYKRENEQWKDRHQRLETMFEDLQREIYQKNRAHSQELEIQKVKFNKMLTEFQNASNVEIEELKLELAGAKQSKQILDDQMMDLKNECDMKVQSIKKDMQFAIQKQQQIEQAEKKQSELQIQNLKYELEGLNQKCQQYENSLKEVQVNTQNIFQLESKYKSVFEEAQKLKEQALLRENELKFVREQLTQAQKNSQVTQNQEKIIIFQKETNALRQKIQELAQLLNQSEERNKQLQMQYQERMNSGNQSEVLKQEIDRLNRTIIQLRQELESKSLKQVDFRFLDQNKDEITMYVDKPMVFEQMERKASQFVGNIPRVSIQNDYGISIPQVDQRMILKESNYVLKDEELRTVPVVYQQNYDLISHLLF